MVKKNTVHNDFELLIQPLSSDQDKLKVKMVRIGEKDLEAYFENQIYLKSSVFILVLSGTIKLDVNFKPYEVRSSQIVLLSFGHFFKVHQVSNGFRCLLLYIDKEYIDEMYSSEMLYKRTKYSVRMYNTPLVDLSERNFKRLKQKMMFVGISLSDTDHLYYKEIVLNTLRVFFLDLGDTLEKDTLLGEESTMSRYESYFQKFLDLLVENYKHYHSVDFYAQQLLITPHYLTLIVKELSGQTASELIFDLIYSEAKLLLQNANLSIQEIAEELSFSDQSAFGKFFKRKSGSSPISYRKKIRQ